MSQQQQQQTKKNLNWKKILSATGLYPIEAFTFVREGLTFTAQRVHADIETLAERDRHINGQQLCIGLRDLAIERYGLLAQVVLGHWHIHRTEDFGRIVFAMIAEGMMSRTDEDSMEDFRGVFDFDEAFNREEMLARIGTS